MWIGRRCIILTVIIFVSCGGNKTPIGTNLANSTLTVKEIIKTHKAASPGFKTMAARANLFFKDEKTTQNITISLRMEKDKVIWIKASMLGFTLAKAIITPDRVRYYEKLSGSYFDGDFALISHWLGTDLDFNKAQDILLGQSIFQLNTSDYNSSVVQNKYKVQPRLQPQNFIHSLLLNPDNFKVALANLSQPDKGRMFTVSYAGHQKIDGAFYPSAITINTSENESKTRIELNYKKIDINVDIRFPFIIPDGYDEIMLN
jgi:hypothetical protein